MTPADAASATTAIAARASPLASSGNASTTVPSPRRRTIRSRQSRNAVRSPVLARATSFRVNATL